MIFQCDPKLYYKYHQPLRYFESVVSITLYNKSIQDRNYTSPVLVLMRTESQECPSYYFFNSIRFISFVIHCGDEHQSKNTTAENVPEMKSAKWSTVMPTPSPVQCNVYRYNPDLITRLYLIEVYIIKMVEYRDTLPEYFIYINVILYIFQLKITLVLSKINLATTLRICSNNFVPPRIYVSQNSSASESKECSHNILLDITSFTFNVYFVFATSGQRYICKLKCINSLPSITRVYKIGQPDSDSLHALAWLNLK